MQEVLSPTPDGEYVGKAVVQEVFNIGGTGNIAGSRCSDGYLRKGGNVRVMRGDKILAESRIRTIRNFKVSINNDLMARSLISEEIPFTSVHPNIIFHRDRPRSTRSRKATNVALA